jgi:hypothetical protein
MKQRILFLTIILSLCHFAQVHAQIREKIVQPAVQTYPQIAEGIPVRAVIILLHKDGKQLIADSAETDRFYEAFGIRPGAGFKQYFADLAVRRTREQPDIKDAYYELYNTELSGPVIFVLHVFFLASGEAKSAEGKQGMTGTRSIRSFPVIHESDRFKLMFLLNGGIGVFNEVNPFFGHGTAFTENNIVATDPANEGVRFWGEAYIEPGLAGITQLGKSKIYAYGAVSVLASGRNTSDIYSGGATSYTAVERLYAGVLGAGLGKKGQTNFDISAGRQFFQLNDGFLISKFSGSANAGQRGSVYLNSRTAFQNSAIGKLHVNNWMVQAFWLEPQELFKQFQQNIQYTGGGLTFNNNKSIDAGLYYIHTSGGTGRYQVPGGFVAKKGMYIVNPKLWLTNIAGTGLFFKSEYAFQSHTSADFRSNAWYAGIGLSKTTWRFRPSLYYRFAYMQGDDSTTQRFERFDPILTGGLGNWVQGINFRKISGNGNIISHRVELKSYFSKSFEVSLDYFFLQAHTPENLGALPPLVKLDNRQLGHEITLTTRYFLNSHFLLLGVLSYAKPGQGIEDAFPDTVYDWTSVQCALFMFF